MYLKGAVLYFETAEGSIHFCLILCYNNNDMRIIMNFIL